MTGLKAKALATGFVVLGGIGLNGALLKKPTLVGERGDLLNNGTLRRAIALLLNTTQGVLVTLQIPYKTNTVAISGLTLGLGYIGQLQKPLL